MSDELNPLARAFLDSVQHADDPSRADFERVRGKVKTRLAAGIAAGIAALTTSRAAAATATTKVAAATAAATSVAPAATIATAGTGAAIAGKIVAVVAVVAAVGGGTSAVVHYAHRAATTQPAPAAASITAPVAVRPAPVPRPQPVPPAANVAPDVRAAPDTAAAPVVPSPARADVPRAPSSPAAAPGAPAAAATGVVTTSSLDAEIALIRDARAALRGGDAARSLALLDEHDRRFPGGALSEDCAAERIYALCALGNADAARAAAARFLADHPYSPHAASVRTSCGGAGGTN